MGEREAFIPRGTRGEVPPRNLPVIRGKRARRRVLAKMSKASNGPNVGRRPHFNIVPLVPFEADDEAGSQGTPAARLSQQIQALAGDYVPKLYGPRVWGQAGRPAIFPPRRRGGEPGFPRLSAGTGEQTHVNNDEGPERICSGVRGWIRTQLVQRSPASTKQPGTMTVALLHPTNCGTAMAPNANFHFLTNPEGATGETSRRAATNLRGWPRPKKPARGTSTVGNGRPDGEDWTGPEPRSRSQEGWARLGAQARVPLPTDVMGRLIPQVRTRRHRTVYRRAAVIGPALESNKVLHPRDLRAGELTWIRWVAFRQGLQPSSWSGGQNPDEALASAGT